MTSENHTWDVEPSAETHFSWMRTRMSVERTFMAWIRTAAALIGFGFTYVLFFERFARLEPDQAARFPRAPRWFALALIAFGVGTLVVALRQYLIERRHLHEHQFAQVASAPARTGHSPMIPLTVAIGIVGVAAFASVLARTL